MTEAKRLQKIQYNERKRALVRMVKYNEEIQSAVIGRNLRKQAQEEQILTRLVKDLQKMEREILLENQKDKKQIDDSLQQKLALKRDALENYFRDQCDILNEEIDQVQREQVIAEKDKVQASCN